MKAMKYIISLSDHRKIIACYAIFLVVRAVDSDETQHEDVPLLSERCSDHTTSELSPRFPADVFTDIYSVDEDPPSLRITKNLPDTDISYVDDPEKPSPSEKPDLQWWGKVFVPIPTPNSQCEAQVERYLKDLRSFELWAMQMWDATAKPAAGLLSGNINQLGDYDSCLAVQLAALGAVQGKYCLAYIDIEASPTALPSVRAAVNKLQAGAFVRSKYSDPGHFAPRWTTVQWGLCVPSACNSSEVEGGLRQFLQSYHLPGVTVDMAVNPGMCYTSPHGTVLPFFTLVTLGFFGGFLMLAAVSTMADTNSHFPVTNKLQLQEPALLAFSLRRTWAALVSSQTDSLPVIHGVRSVFTVMLFAAHKLIPLALTPYSNRGFLTQCSHSALSAVLRASSLFTDSFLQLSGVLTAFNLGKELHRHGSIAWSDRILSRFIRLTPSLFAVVLFYAYVIEHLGSGPQWTSSVTINADLCKTNLWKNVLYIQNFFQFEDMCAPHTHQLALDMQLSLVAPVVVYGLHHWPVYSVILLVLVQVAIAVLRYATHLHFHLSDFIYHNISVKDLYRNANLSYSQAVHRGIPYIIGLITGFFLHKFGKLQLSYRQAAAGWVTCTVLAMLSIFYPAHLARADAVFDVADGAWYAAVSPITWSLALTWLILACTSGYGGWLHKALCRHWLVVLSRLSYSIYLTQFIVFFYYVGRLRSNQEFSLFYVIGAYEVLAVLLTSIIVTLLFDLPMQEIKSILLSGYKASRCEKVS